MIVQQADLGRPEAGAPLGQGRGRALERLDQEALERGAAMAAGVELTAGVAEGRLIVGSKTEGAHGNSLVVPDVRALAKARQRSTSKSRRRQAPQAYTRAPPASLPPRPRSIALAMAPLAGGGATNRKGEFQSLRYE